MAKEKPGTINFASAGNGTGQHLSTVLFELGRRYPDDARAVSWRRAGLHRRHVGTDASVLRQSRECPGADQGRLRARTLRWLGRSVRPRCRMSRRSPRSGVQQYVYVVWFGLWARKATPQPIVAKLYAEVQKALDSPAVKERITADTGTPMHMPQADIEPFVKGEIAKWADVIKRAGDFGGIAPARWCLAAGARRGTCDVGVRDARSASISSARRAQSRSNS